MLLLLRWRFFDYRFDYNKKSKTAYGRPNGHPLPRIKD